MATLEMKIKAEMRMRELLEREGVPPPDEVEYGYGCIRLLWHESKTCFVIDIDDYSQVDDEDAEVSEVPQANAPPPNERRGPPFTLFPYTDENRRN